MTTTSIVALALACFIGFTIGAAIAYFVYKAGYSDGRIVGASEATLKSGEFWRDAIDLAMKNKGLKS